MAYNTNLKASLVTTPQINSSGILYINTSSYAQFAGGITFHCGNFGSDATLNPTQTVIMCTGLGAPITLTLPAVVGLPSGFTYFIKDVDGTAVTNTITLDGDGAEEIDGSPTYVINNPYQAVTICNNGTSWSIL